MIRTQSAPAPVGEAQPLNLPASSQPTKRSHGGTSAPLWLRTLRALWRYVVATEVPASVYGIERCPDHEGVVIHLPGEMCSRQNSGQCSICGPVLLTFAGNCPYGENATRSTHVVPRSSIHATTEAEWRRPRLVPTPCVGGERRMQR